MKYFKLRGLFYIVILVAGVCLAACGSHSGKRLEGPPESIDDLRQARLGTWTESGEEYYLEKLFPEAKFVRLDYLSDLVQNLLIGKVDAIMIQRIMADILIKEGMAIDYFPDTLCSVPDVYAFTVSERGRILQQQVNEYVAAIDADGTLDSLKRKWLEGEENDRFFTRAESSGENGTIVIGSSVESVPYSYIKNGEATGYEIEILDRFCAAYGYKYKLITSEFDAMIASLSAGKIDIAASYIEDVPGRDDNVLFSIPIEEGCCVMVYRTGQAVGGGFLRSLGRKVRATLIDEDRWKMIAGGIGVTLVITLLASVFGTLLGFVVYLLYHEKHAALNRIIDTSVRFLQGLPDLILLMFFYYAVFGNVDIGGTIVAVIVFALILSVSVFIMLKSGSESIPKGQTEAALALGFTERRTFLKFILPQVVTVFFPTYQNKLVDLMLSTSVVGYIAVQDLTRVGDLIRSRTFDAFVPLIIASLIYFLISWLIIKGMDLLLKRIDTRNRKPEQILKGVK